MVQLAADNLAVLPPDWLYENLGTPGLTSVYVRGVLVLSLGELGRFAEATPHCAEVIRLAESAHHD